jgi:hypothetical protein
MRILSSQEAQFCKIKVTTNSSGSKKRKGSKISLLNKNRKLGLIFKVPSDLESAEERKK